jgi:hypothetical protein
MNIKQIKTVLNTVNIDLEFIGVSDKNIPLQLTGTDYLIRKDKVKFYIYKIVKK